MSSILDVFRIFDPCPQHIKQNIKVFYVKVYDRQDFYLAICVTNDDKVYAFGDIENYFMSENKNFDNNCVLINELCDQNIEQFFCFFKCFFARNVDHKIFCSGNNRRGQLTSENKLGVCLSPKRIMFFDNKNIIDISSGFVHCLALSNDGQVYGWGDNSEHQFDKSENKKKYLKPVLIDSEFIECCGNSSILVNFDGFVYILNPNEWQLKYKITELSGVNKIYQPFFNCTNIIMILKNNGSLEISTPEETRTFENSFKYCQQFCDILFISKDKEIKIIDLLFGRISNSEHKTAFEYFLFEYKSTFKTIILRDNKLYFKEIEFNDNNQNELILKEKEIICEFNNQNHSMIPENFNVNNPLPNRIESDVKVYHQIGSQNDRYYSVFIVKNDNKVYAKGYNENGILGLGHKQRVDNFSLIKELCDQNIEEFFEGIEPNLIEYHEFIFARNNKNQIYSWGNNNIGGQLARVNENDDFLKPMKIDFFDDKNIIEISCGDFHCLGLTEDGLIYGWGDNYFGQTGSRCYNKIELKPIKIQLNSGFDDRIKFINCYKFTSCAVTVDGRAYLWGDIDGRKMVIPKLIETDVSKMLIISKKMFSILKINQIFSVYEAKNKSFLLFFNTFEKNVISQNENVIDIFNSETFLIEDKIFEFYENRNFGTNFSNSYEYFWHKKKKIIHTIHITSDGSLMKPILELNLNQKQKLLNKNSLIFLMQNLKYVLK